MKTFRLFGMVLMTVLMSVGFTACSSDDDNDNGYSSAIVETWMQQNASGYSVELTFNSDGTCSELTKLESTSAKMKYNGTYNVKGDKLTIIWTEYLGWNFLTNKWLDLDKDTETVIITISINGNKMTFLSMEGEETQNQTVYIKE